MKLRKTLSQEQLARLEREKVYWNKVLPLGNEVTFDIISGEAAVAPPEGSARDDKLSLNAVRRAAAEVEDLAKHVAENEAFLEAHLTRDTKEQLIEKLASKGVTFRRGLHIEIQTQQADTEVPTTES